MSQLEKLRQSPIVIVLADGRRLTVSESGQALHDSTALYVRPDGVEKVMIACLDDVKCVEVAT